MNRHRENSIKTLKLITYNFKHKMFYVEDVTHFIYTLLSYVS
jgi:hypothetical protein